LTPVEQSTAGAISPHGDRPLPARDLEAADNATRRAGALFKKRRGADGQLRIFLQPGRLGHCRRDLAARRSARPRVFKIGRLCRRDLGAAASWSLPARDLEAPEQRDQARRSARPRVFKIGLISAGARARGGRQRATRRGARSVDKPSRKRFQEKKSRKYA
jgi:hypothetical protein